jgi:hypothetical protein
MTEHVPIQDPDAYSDEDMMELAESLFSPSTPTEELERVCMLLAHLPTEGAQELLARFRESPRASEITWLETAVDEGAFHLLSPRNELEEHEFLTLKVIEEIEDRIVDLYVRRDDLDLQRSKLEIRQSAIQALIAAGHLDPDEALGLDDALLCLRNDIHEVDARLEVEETVAQHLKDSITTPRYKSADPHVIRHMHLS